MNGAGQVLRVSLLLGRRNLTNVVRIPGNVVTVVGLPILVLVMFAGAFDSLTRLPGFPTRDSLRWVLPQATLIGAAFTGLGAASNLQRDIAGGFIDRLAGSPSPWTALLLGEVVGSIGRAYLQFAAVLAVAAPAGFGLGGSVVGLALLALASAGVATWSALWALGLMSRLHSAQGLGLVTTGIFAVSLLSTGQIPLAYQAGWLHAVARVNPLTPVFTMGRQGLAGGVTWGDTWPGLAALVVVTMLLALLAATGLRRLHRAR